MSLRSSHSKIREKLTLQTIKDAFLQVSSINKQFAFICDVITKIPNRELLYDLIPYLTNVRVILSACSRYLQWVGLRDCRKPLRCGPTLAGLSLSHREARLQQKIRFAWRCGWRPDATLPSAEYGPIPLDWPTTLLFLHCTSIPIQVSPHRNPVCYHVSHTGLVRKRPKS